jgi:adenylosuccinate synthase
MARVSVVLGLQFGDESKGQMVHRLCAPPSVYGGHVAPSYIVRFNGGAQAAHNVHVSSAPDTFHHTFHSFGSGTLARLDWQRPHNSGPTPTTVLSEDFLIDPWMLLKEADALAKLLGRSTEALVEDNLIYDQDCLVVLPTYGLINQVREYIRTSIDGSSHGSCGFGIGECVSNSLQPYSHVIRMKHLTGAAPASINAFIKAVFSQHAKIIKLMLPSNWELTFPAHLISKIKDYCFDTYDLANGYSNWIINEFVPLFKDSGYFGAVSRMFDSGIADRDHVVFEGAQGVLLDEDWGFHPHTTWSKTTTFNVAKHLKNAGFNGDVVTYGCTRAYTTRHGAGPLPTEVDFPFHNFMEDNTTGEWQGNFRYGHLDVPLLDYALKATEKDGLGVDVVVLSHVDDVLSWNNLLNNNPKIEIVTQHEIPNLGVYESLELSPNRGDLDYQENLTNALSQSVPVLNGTCFETIEHTSRVLERVLNLNTKDTTVVTAKGRIDPMLSLVTSL